MQLRFVLFAVTLASALQVQAESDGALYDTLDGAKDAATHIAGQSSKAVSDQLPHITPEDLCQNDGAGDVGGICEGKLTGKTSSDDRDGFKKAFKKADAPAGFRRASPEETINILCFEDGEMKAGFCDSNLPIAQADDKTKAPIGRRSTMELIRQLIPRNEPTRRSTSTVHLCSRDGQAQEGMQQIRGFAGLCKRVDTSSNGAFEGALTGATKGFEGAEKGYEADKKKLVYSLQHPDQEIASGLQVAASTVQQGVQSALSNGMHRRQLNLLLPCVKDEDSGDKSGFCDSLVPVAEERDVVDLIRRSIHFTAHRRFARPLGSSK